MDYENQSQEATNSKYDCLLFDIDDTLYPLSSGLAAEVKKNIQEYMVQKLNIEESEVQDKCLALYQKYGTTMAGLRATGYNFDYDDFHSFVHGRLPYDYLKPDPVLRNLLLSVPLRKLVFTNADKGHAARVLSRLGLEDCFEAIICFETLNSIGEVTNDGTDDSSPRTQILCKPLESSFEKVFNITNINPHKTLFFDDSIRNIQSGKKAGLHTVLIGSSERKEGADYALESIHNIREAFPELWDLEKSEGFNYSEKVGIETKVEA